MNELKLTMQETDSLCQDSPSAVLNGSSEYFWGIAISLCINSSPYRHKILRNYLLTKASPSYTKPKNHVWRCKHTGTHLVYNFLLPSYFEGETTFPSEKCTVTEHNACQTSKLIIRIPSLPNRNNKVHLASGALGNFTFSKNPCIYALLHHETIHISLDANIPNLVRVKSYPKSVYIGKFHDIEHNTSALLHYWMLSCTIF